MTLISDKNTLNSIEKFEEAFKSGQKAMKIKAIEVFCLTACGGVCPKKTFMCEKRTRFIKELNK